MFGLEPPWLTDKQWMATDSGQFLLDRYRQLHPRLQAYGQRCIIAITDPLYLQSRKRHADVLEFILFLNVHSEVTYMLMYGDKDTFELAFALAGKSENFQKMPAWERSALSAKMEVSNLACTVPWTCSEPLLK